MQVGPAAGCHFVFGVQNVEDLWPNSTFCSKPFKIDNIGPVLRHRGPVGPPPVGQLVTSDEWQNKNQVVSPLCEIYRLCIYEAIPINVADPVYYPRLRERQRQQPLFKRQHPVQSHFTEWIQWICKGKIWVSIYNTRVCLSICLCARIRCQLWCWVNF